MKHAVLLLTFLSLSIAPLRGESPDTVRTGAYVISVHDISFHDKEYTIRFWLWFTYSNPKFDFTRQLDIPNAKSIDPPEVIRDTVDGKFYVIMKMKCVMKESWNVGDFPFDSQQLHVQIENTLFDKNALVFLPDTAGSRYEQEMAIDGWSMKKFAVGTGRNGYETAFGDTRINEQHTEFATFNIDMEIQRDALGLFMKIFLGMYIAFLIAMVSFVPRPSELEPRFGLPVGGLFAAVGNKYIIDSLLPESSQFTLVDSLHALTFFGIFSMLVVSAVALKLHERGRENLSLTVSRYGAIAIGALYFLINLGLVVASAY